MPSTAVCYCADRKKVILDSHMGLHVNPRKHDIIVL